MTPVTSSCRLVGSGSLLVTRFSAGLINIKMDGNWMPVCGVSTDVVGGGSGGLTS